MTLSPKQLALRRTGVTATDVSAIIGLNPYKSAVEVYLDKIGKPVPREQTEAMHWGTALEPLLAKRYAEVTGNKVRRAGVTRRGPEPWMLATPDGYAQEAQKNDDDESIWGPRFGLQLKTAFSANQVKRWGVGGDQVPQEYIVQCAWERIVCQMDRWDLAVLLGGYHGAEFRIYTLWRDLALENRLIEITREFHEDNVLKRVCPHPDGSTSAANALRALYDNPTEIVMVANEEMQDAASDLRLAKETEAEAKKEHERLKQEWKVRLGDEATGCQGPGFSITWRPNRAGNRIFNSKFWD